MPIIDPNLRLDYKLATHPIKPVTADFASLITPQ
jgi:hypothetical protein